MRAGIYLFTKTGMRARSGIYGWSLKAGICAHEEPDHDIETSLSNLCFADPAV